MLREFISQRLKRGLVRRFNNLNIALFILFFFSLSTCSAPTPTALTETPLTVFTETPRVTSTPVVTITPTVPTVTVTPSPAMIERPLFLGWPLPAHIGIARISQYPNTPWTWNYLGLNDGYQCPPMFGYLLNLDSLPYWRDTSIPEEQDRAQADPHQFEMVECYSTSNNGGANGHEGTDIKAPAGTPVFATANGLVQEWRLAGLNSMIVLKHCIYGTWDANHQCAGGRQWYTTYMHIIPDTALLEENLAVAQGAQLGTIYDQTINSHLHFEVGLDKRGYENYVNPWGQDEFPWLGCMWLDQSLCVNPDPDYKRLAWITTTGRLFILQGALTVQVLSAQGLKQIRLWGERAAVIDADGNLRIRDGRYDGLSVSDDLTNWKIAASNVVDFQITNRRVAILDGNRNLLVKENALEGDWVLQAENVRAYSVSDHRIGYLTVNGELFIKEGGLESNWILVANNVVAFQAIDNRVAFIDLQGNLFVNEGEASSEYKQMAANVKAFQLTNVRLGVIDAEGKLQVKEGNLRAKWVALAENVQSFQLADYRVLMFSLDGRFNFKEGSLYQPWSDLPYADLTGAFLNDGMPVFVR